MSAKTDLTLTSSSSLVTKGKRFLKKGLNIFTQGKVCLHPVSDMIVLLAHLLFCLPEKLRGWEKDWAGNAENKRQNMNKIGLGRKGRKDGKGRWKTAAYNTRVEEMV